MRAPIPTPSQTPTACGVGASPAGREAGLDGEAGGGTVGGDAGGALAGGVGVDGIPLGIGRTRDDEPQRDRHEQGRCEPRFGRLAAVWRLGDQPNRPVGRFEDQRERPALRGRQPCQRAR